MERIKKQLRKLNGIPLNVWVVIGYFLCSLIQRGFSVLATPIFTRLMTPEEYAEIQKLRDTDPAAYRTRMRELQQKLSQAN